MPVDREVNDELLTVGAAFRGYRVLRRIGVGGTGEVTGLYFVAMDYLPGGTLADQLGKGPYSISGAVRVISRVAAVLEFARQRGIVHRDIKPANIMFGCGSVGARNASGCEDRSGGWPWRSWIAEICERVRSALC